MGGAVIDPGTWGNTPACKMLAEELSNVSEDIFHDVNWTLSHFSKHLSQLRCWRWDGQEFHVLLLFNHYKKQAKSYNWPAIIESCVLNIMTAKCRGTKLYKDSGAPQA